MWHQLIPAMPGTTATFDPGPRKQTLELPVLAYDHDGDPLILFGKAGLVGATEFAEANKLELLTVSQDTPPVIVPAQHGLFAIYEKRRKKTRTRFPVVAWKVYPDLTDICEPVVFVGDNSLDDWLLIDVVDGDGRSIVRQESPEAADP